MLMVRLQRSKPRQLHVERMVWAKSDDAARGVATVPG
jgi:hypothetical protein